MRKDVTEINRKPSIGNENKVVTTETLLSINREVPSALKMFYSVESYNDFLRSWKKTTVSRVQGVQVTFKHRPEHTFSEVTIQLNCKPKIAIAIEGMFRPQGYFGQRGFSARPIW